MSSISNTHSGYDERLEKEARQIQPVLEINYLKWEVWSH